MYKKKIRIFAFIFFLILLIGLIFNFFFPDKCKTSKIYVPIKDLGFSVIYNCFDEYLIKENIKNKLKSNKIIYDLLYDSVAKIKITFFPNYGKSRDIYKFLNSGDLVEEEKNLSTENELDNTNNVKKNIEGILNDEIQLKKIYKKSNVKEVDYKSWKRSHGDNWNSKFFDLKKINKNNIDKLNLVWKFNTIKKSELKKKWKQNIEINPIYFDGIVYFVSADWKLNAVTADRGDLIWSKQFFHAPSRRGILLHLNKNNNKKSIFIASGKRLLKLDSKTGKLDKKFGKSGSIYVKKTLFAPLVYKNQIILTDTKGIISSYNLETGILNFSENIHPVDEAKHYSSPWSGAALDKKNGLYFLVTGNPKPSLYGADRPGDNKNSNSLIAFDINKKKINWTFQEVSHDLWDFDLSSPPILANLKHKDNFIEAVIITTKIGNTFVFERNTGQSLFDIKYKKAPTSNVPNEKTSNLQLYNELPESFSKLEFEIKDLREDLISNSNFYNNFIEKSVYGWFTPPTLGKETVIYGIHGGNNWYGSAIDPFKQILYIPTNHVPYKLRIFPTSIENNLNFEGKFKNAHSIYMNKCSSCHQANRNGYLEQRMEKEISYVPSLVGLTILDPLKNKLENIEKIKSNHKDLKLTNKEFDELKNLFTHWDNKILDDKLIRMNSHWLKYYGPDGMLINKPPFNEIVAIDIISGKIIWRSTWGYENTKNGIKNIGSLNNGGIALSSTGLVFANGTRDSYAMVFDAENGEELWKYKMDADGTAPPLIYKFKGKEYISFISTGGIKFDPNNNKKSSILYTFSLNE